MPNLPPEIRSPSPAMGDSDEEDDYPVLSDADMHPIEDLNSINIESDGDEDSISAPYTRSSTTISEIHPPIVVSTNDYERFPEENRVRKVLREIKDNNDQLFFLTRFDDGHTATVCLPSILTFNALCTQLVTNGWIMARFRGIH